MYFYQNVDFAFYELEVDSTTKLEGLYRINHSFMFTFGRVCKGSTLKNNFYFAI